MASNRCNPSLYYNRTLQNQFQTPRPEVNPRNEQFEASFVLLLCLTGQQCYETHQQCDGIRDCADGTDELFCEKGVKSEQISDFIVYRKNRNNFFYLSTGDNFAWTDTFTSYNPDNYVGIGNVPQRAVNWRFNSIGVCPETGFSIMDRFVYVRIEIMSLESNFKSITNALVE